MNFVERLMMEPPFRHLARQLLRPFVRAPSRRARWHLSPRPAYLMGMLEAVRQAAREGVDAISVIELGVAEGEGLLAMEKEAEALESVSGIRIRLFGFDRGGGLPELIGDHRDHPNYWRPGDFPMDPTALQERLTNRSTLVLGDVRETVPSFFEEYDPPTIGFVAFDLDLYSSTAAALPLLRSGRILQHCPLYFDDVVNRVSHRFAGELLAIREHNRESKVKIDRWRGVEVGRAFPEYLFFQKMYMAHDLPAIAEVELDRDIRQLSVRF